MRRMLVMPEKLAALHIGKIDDGKAGSIQSLKRKTGEKDEEEVKFDRSTKQTYDGIISKTPGDRSSTQMCAGVNPIALITRLRFLQSEIEQNERLLLA
ncbi:hypothetical protein GGI05_006351 [Coemansia sp. RSA 2603]|nr:hypothetical protein GGI05_006351 [Coemansia sp. RSA 2603]